jgi:hypothetical protein
VDALDALKVCVSVLRVGPRADATAAAGKATVDRTSVGLTGARKRASLIAKPSCFEHGNGFGSPRLFAGERRRLQRYHSGA